MRSERSPQNRGVSRRDVLRRGAVATAIAGLGLSSLTGSAAAGGTGGTGVPDDAIPIDGPTEITEPGYYVLTKDIVSKTNTVVIAVEPGTDDVTIDGRGHTIKGPGKDIFGSVGIDVGEYTDANTNDPVVKNVIVTGFDIGIEFGDTNRGLISNVKVTHCDWGIYLLENRDLTIADSIVAKNNDAFFQDEGSPGLALLRNRITRNDIVGTIDFADESVVADNRIDYNDSGFGFSNSSGLRVTGNLFYQNREGFDISEYVGVGSDNVIRGNRFIENERYGIDIDGSDSGLGDVVIEENDVFRNGSDGVKLRGVRGPSTVSKNRVIGNGGDGVLLSGSDQTEIVGNLVRQNAGDGIELRSAQFSDDGSDDNVVRENIIRENGDLAIRIDELSTGNVVENNQIGDDAPDTCRLEDY
ncbi:nitrous oxide reductase family maturation protein NosD [Haloferax sp. YSMS24]|uniref:right-handed parallel beta-helix repeat-containing protein n=1 Tax=Haloferax sp. YSMS24 TaxID=3388425 RepID=UPI00398D24D4